MKQRAGFTLVEVMIAVMIIAVVISSLLKLFSTNASFFDRLYAKSNLSMNSSLLLGFGDTYGFEKDEITLDELTKEFNVEDELRQKLKNTKALINYKDILILDSKDFEDNAEDVASEDQLEDLQNAPDTGFSLEIGKTSFTINNNTTSYLRIKLP